MKSFFLIAIVTLLLQSFLPWWVIMLVPFILCIFFGKSGRESFFSSLFATLLIWTGYSLFIWFNTGGVLAERIAVVFHLPSGIALVIIGILIGAIASAVSGWAGFNVRSLFTIKYN
jgi:hypothetical protein